MPRRTLFTNTVHQDRTRRAIQTLCVFRICQCIFRTFRTRCRTRIRGNRVARAYWAIITGLIMSRRTLFTNTVHQDRTRRTIQTLCVFRICQCIFRTFHARCRTRIRRNCIARTLWTFVARLIMSRVAWVTVIIYRYITRTTFCTCRRTRRSVIGTCDSRIYKVCQTCCRSATCTICR